MVKIFLMKCIPIKLLLLIRENITMIVLSIYSGIYFQVQAKTLVLNWDN